MCKAGVIGWINYIDIGARFGVVCLLSYHNDQGGIDEKNKDL